VLDREVLGSVVVATDRATLGGVEYVVADCGRHALSAAELAVVSNLSSLHAAYVVEADVLRPVSVTPLRRHDDDVTTIQRYVGKTNEALTHLLVNLALAASADGFPRVLRGEPVRLLDPACGRGTTLNRAVVYGMDAVGVEHDRKDVEAYEAFLVGWLKDKRLKHEVERQRHRKGRAAGSQRTTITYGTGKDKAQHRVVDVIMDDTAAVGGHLKPRSIDLLVCDLPYGVQHGSTAAAGLRRDPDDLLAGALPAWREVMKPGAGMALAWNRRTLARAQLIQLLGNADLELVTPPGDERFVHRVDRSITRDVVVARRPSP
jgi:tRNA G10  N-methylase Trm11